MGRGLNAPAGNGEQPLARATACTPTLSAPYSAVPGAALDPVRHFLLHQKHDAAGRGGSSALSISGEVML